MSGDANIDKVRQWVNNIWNHGEVDRLHIPSHSFGSWARRYEWSHLVLINNQREIDSLSGWKEQHTNDSSWC